MKRWILRLSPVGAIVVLGLLAYAYSQWDSKTSAETADGAEQQPPDEQSKRPKLRSRPLKSGPLKSGPLNSQSTAARHSGAGTAANSAEANDNTDDSPVDPFQRRGGSTARAATSQVGDRYSGRFDDDDPSGEEDLDAAGESVAATDDVEAGDGDDDDGDGDDSMDDRYEGTQSVAAVAADEDSDGAGEFVTDEETLGAGDETDGAGSAFAADDEGAEPDDAADGSAGAFVDGSDGDSGSGGIEASDAGSGAGAFGSRQSRTGRVENPSSLSGVENRGSRDTQTGRIENPSYLSGAEDHGSRDTQTGRIENPFYDQRQSESPLAAAPLEESDSAGGFADADDAATQIDGSGRPGEAVLEGPQTPSLVLRKLAPEEIQVGKSATFEIVVRNQGSVPAHGVELRDQVPEGTRLIDTEPKAQLGADGELAWDLGTIKPGDEVTVRMNLLPTAEGEIGSVATLRFSAEASVKTFATRPELIIDVQSPDQVLIGEQVKVSIRVTNTGSGKATGVIVENIVPDGLKHAAGAEIEYEVGELKPNESHDLELLLVADKPGLIENTITAFGDGNLRIDDRRELEVIAPALEIEMAGPKRRYLDRPATYTLTVLNPGTAAAREVELITYLPKGLKFVSANNAGQYDPETGAVYWLLEELPPQREGSVKLTTLPTEAGEQTIKIEGTAKSGLSVKTEQPVLVEGVAALLFQLADVNDPIEVGAETAYEIRVVNQGSKQADNVRVVMELPDGLKPLDADGPTSHRIAGQQVVFDPLPKLAPKADTTYQVRAQGIAPGDLRVRVQLLTDEMRTPVTKEESTNVYADE